MTHFTIGIFQTYGVTANVQNTPDNKPSILHTLGTEGFFFQKNKVFCKNLFGSLKTKTRSQELGLPEFSPKEPLAERGARDHLESPL